MFKKVSTIQMVIIVATLVVGAGVAVYAYTIGSRPPVAKNYTTTVVGKMDLSESVNVTGTVNAAQALDLGFNSAGTIASVNADVGDTVKKGEIIASLDNADMEAELQSAQAAESEEQIKLQALEAPSSNSSVGAGVANGSANLIDKLSDGYVQIDNALGAYTDGLFSDPKGNAAFGTTITEGVTTVSISAPATLTEKLNSERRGLNTLLNQWNALDQQMATSSTDAQIQSTTALAEKTFQATQTFLTDLGQAVNSLQATDSGVQAVYSGYQASVAAARNEVQGALSALRAAEQSYTSSASTVSPYALTLEQASLQSAQAHVASVDAELADENIVSPIDGIVTVQNAKVGEVASQGTALISLISAGTLQIQSYVSESDIAAVKVGQNANVTIDALAGNIFSANVILIDPAETVVNGAPSYKVTLEFASSSDEIKTGMTANVSIITATSPQAIAIPDTAVIADGTEDSVMVVVNGAAEKQVVTLGIHDSNGYDEVTSGLSEGQSVITFGN